jgi:polygalacturonase
LQITYKWKWARFLMLSLLGIAAAPALIMAAVEAPATEVGWGAVPAILNRIKAPTFAARDFPIQDFGALADGSMDCTAAIRKAVEACNAAGGGRVTVRGGTFLTGPIHLLSNVNLYVEAGATLKFFSEPEKYLPLVLTRFEGMECMNYSPLVYALDQQNIAITGGGVLDGGGKPWYKWKGSKTTGIPQKAARDKLVDQVAKGIPVAERIYGEGSLLRPNFIQPYRCKNILIEGVKIVNSPMWVLNPVLCENVTIRSVTVDSYPGANTDGCDPESCRDVLVEDCVFKTGDDCIAIKSGRNDDGRRIGVPSENIIIRNCVMNEGHGGMTIGSEISGGVRNVYVSNCKMDSPHLDRALRFKSNAVRGGVLENIYIRDITIGQVKKAVLSVEFNYEEGANGPHQPVLRNVFIENVKSQSSERAIILSGFAGAVIENIRLKDCDFMGVKKTNLIEGTNPPEMHNVQIGLPLPTKQ